MKKLLFLLLLFIVVNVQSISVYAHTLKVDGNVGVTMHINPDDEPKVNEPSTILLSIEDRAQKITSLASCNCTLEITPPDGNSEIITVAGTELKSTIPYTFTQAGIHKIKFTGSSLSDSTYKFTTEFTHKIGGATPVNKLDENQLSNYLPLAATFTATVLLMLFLIPVPGKRR